MTEFPAWLRAHVRWLRRASAPAVPATTHQPIEVSMSDSSSGTIAVALQLNVNDPSWTPGKFTDGITVTQADGTAPTIVSLGGAGVAASIVPNTGANATTEPYSITGTATAVGSASLAIVADGVQYTVYDITVTALPPQQLAGDPATLVITPPGPPAA